MKRQHTGMMSMDMTDREQEHWANLQQAVGDHRPMVEFIRHRFEVLRRFGTGELGAGMLPLLPEQRRVAERMGEEAIRNTDAEHETQPPVEAPEASLDGVQEVIERCLPWTRWRLWYGLNDLEMLSICTAMVGDFEVRRAASVALKGDAGAKKVLFQLGKSALYNILAMRLVEAGRYH